MQAPLVVDLDGTLIRTDMLHESALAAFRKNPLDFFRYCYWLVKGKAALKHEIAQRCEVDPTTLPYNKDLLVWLHEQKAEGRQLILCTASDKKFASEISDHLGLFDDVIASNGIDNITGKHKAAALESRFGRKGFDYIGNSSSDLFVWNAARRAILVTKSKALIRKATRITRVEKVFNEFSSHSSDWRDAFRIHQWLKNLLLFVPMLAAHQVTNPGTWVTLLWAFLSFSLCASAVYIANDLMDLGNDRQHPRKHNRPFAAGRLPVMKGLIAVPLLLAVSFLLGSIVGNNFLITLAIYFGLTCFYSFGLKRIILIDCLLLAILYILRIVAGSAATGHTLSFWILAFSVFLFLSLAFIKRYAELEIQLHAGKKITAGRGYLTSDAPLIQSLGISAGYASVLVLALYINSDAVVQLYSVPEIVWGTVPILVFWISWMWLHAHRGLMNDDPLVFAVKNKTSLVSGLAFALVVIVGWTGLPW